MKTKVKFILSVILFVIDSAYLLSVNRWLRDWLIATERYKTYYLLHDTTFFFLLFAIILFKMAIGFWDRMKIEKIIEHQHRSAVNDMAEDFKE